MADHFGISLVKGQNVQLTGLRRVIVGCGWEANISRSSNNFDLDVACALLNNQRKMQNRSDFIYYGNLQSPHGCVTHTGDNLTGDGDGDDERLLIDLDKVPLWVEFIPIIVCIYQASQRRQNFGLIQNSFIRLIDITHEQNLSFQGPLYQSTSYPNHQFCKYDIGENNSTSDGLIFGELYRYQGEWKFKAIEKELFGGFNTVLNSFI